MRLEDIKEKIVRVRWTKPFIIIIAFIGGVLLVNQSNSPHISYTFEDAIPTTTSQFSLSIITSTATPTLTFSPSITPYVIQNDDFVPPQRDFYLYVPSLSIKVPIIPNVNGADKEAYLKTLENGVAHYAGTNLPGEVGKVFIFGHSSYYRNRPGNYKQIFASINNLKAGEKIIVYYQGQEYLYLVTSQQIVMPDDTSVLRSNSNQKILSLQTCWPPGTVEKRLIVNAEQANP